MNRNRRVAVAAASALAAAALIASTAGPALASAPAHHGRTAAAKHVLLLSVDGLHQKDLVWYAKKNPRSALAQLVRQGTSYSHAQTPVPSDSFPGMVGQVTGGDPGVTGIYYDDTYNHALLPAGTTSCAGVAPGTEVALTEAADKNPLALDAGQGLVGLPASILSMTGKPVTLLDPAQLPVDPATCKPVYPHQYLKVNTIFEVAKKAGFVTAWSDKHPAYEILNGPSGTGVDDLFTPEINSATSAPYVGGDWTTDNAATQQYDGYKVQAVLNEINGQDHSGTTKQKVPGIFGMNFQSVSTAQKLPTSDGLQGGYLDGGTVPGPLLQRALDFVDSSVARMRYAIQKDGLADSTTIVLSAKHGQSPTNVNTLVRVPDAPIIDGLNAAWKAAHPAAADLVAFSTDDDIMQLWLSNHSQEATAFAKAYLASHSATGNTVSGATKTVTKSGLDRIFAGTEADKYFHAALGDPRTPDILGIASTGVVYTGGTKKIAEHGGASADDRNVPLVVSSFSTDRKPVGAYHQGRVVTSTVETTQIAPTILSVLGLDPRALQAVRIEGTKVLPSH